MTDINLNSPNKGLLSDAMTDVPVDNAAAARTCVPEGLTLAEEEELRSELAKVTRRWPSAVGLRACPAGREQTQICGANRAGLGVFLQVLLWCYLWISQLIVEMHKAGRYFKHCGTLCAPSQKYLI